MHALHAYLIINCLSLTLSDCHYEQRASKLCVDKTDTDLLLVVYRSTSLLACKRYDNVTSWPTILHLYCHLLCCCTNVSKNILYIPVDM